MWIHIQNPTKRLKLPELDAVVEFSENNTAQVSEDVGELLIASYETITEYNND